MADVFGAKENTFRKFHAGKATVTGLSTAAIALNVTVSFQRSVEKVPVLGSTSVLSVGEPTGTLSISSLLSAGDVLASWSKACDSNSITLTFNEAECGGGASKTITCHNCMLQSVNLTAQGGRGYVSEDVVFTFTALEA